ncbi:MAG: helix-turn-helix transcriptional regulator [Chitinophagales bacterium]
MQSVKDDGFLELLGRRIRSVRLSKGYTQLDLAVRINNHAEQIGRIERGELNVSICSLKKIADALDLSLSDLVKVN